MRGQEIKSRFLIMDASAQATIEAIFLLPFMVAFFMFIYQSYIILNKASIAQKSLRGAVIRSTLSRYDVEEVGFLQAGTSPSGKFSFRYQDPQSQGVKYSIGTLTGNLILLFASSEQYSKLNEKFRNFFSPMQMGICTGGESVMRETISPEVLQRGGNAPWTCLR